MIDLQWDRNFALEQSGDDEEILAELLGLLQESCVSDLMKIKEGLAAKDGTAVADAAHSIKGAAASLGVESLRQVVYEIEKAGRKGELDRVTKVLADLEGITSLLKQLK